MPRGWLSSTCKATCRGGSCRSFATCFHGWRSTRSTAVSSPSRREQAARDARARILQWTGIRCCVGIGPTKTLAKAANKIAKKTGHGVVELGDPLMRSEALKVYPVDDLWGVGRKWSQKLGAEGVFSPQDLVDADPETLRSRYGVTWLEPSTTSPATSV